MSINRDFNINELIKIATENNTDQKDTIDDLIFELSKCKVEMNRSDLPSVSQLINDENTNEITFNSNKTLSKILAKPIRSNEAVIKKAIVYVGVTGAGISCFSDLIAVAQFLTGK